VPRAHPCGWQVKLCDPSLTRVIPERFRDEFLIIKRYTNLRSLHFTIQKLIHALFVKHYSSKLLRILTAHNCYSCVLSVSSRATLINSWSLPGMTCNAESEVADGSTGESVAGRRTEARPAAASASVVALRLVLD